MKNLNDADPGPDPHLEAVLDAALRELPPVRAPEALARSVMAAVRERARGPWWTQVWWEWPWPVKLGSLLLGLGLAGAFGGGSVLFDNGIADYMDRMTELLAPVSGLLEAFGSLWQALLLVCSVEAQPWLLTGAVGLGALYLLFVGLGTAFVRTTWKRA